jgi:hypothetical protein
MATPEKFKAAEREHKEILLAGTGQGVVQRSANRIEAIKRLCTTPRENYGEHFREPPMLASGEKPCPFSTSGRTTVPTVPHGFVSKRLSLFHCPLANGKTTRWVFPVILKTNRNSTLR